MCIISQTKILNGATLLRTCIDIIIQMQGENNGFRTSTGRGCWGLSEVQMLHVADAIRLFNRSWMKMLPGTIVKCWLKIKCLAIMDEGEEKGILRDGDDNILMDQ